MEQENRVNENQAESAQKQIPEWEAQLQEMMKNAYLTGLSKGGKSFVGVLYKQLLEGKKKKLNPAKILMNLEHTCKRLLSVADFDPTGKAAESAETEQEEQENENAEKGSI